MYLELRRMYSFTRLKLFSIDKNPTARWSFHLKLLTFLLFVTVMGVFLKSINSEWHWFQDQSQHSGQHDGQHDGQRGGQHDGECDVEHDGECDVEHDGHHDGEHDGERSGGRNGGRDGQHDGQRGGQHDGECDGEHNGQHDGEHDGERDGQHDGERDGQHDGERDGQHDGERDGQHDGEHDGQHDHADKSQQNLDFSEGTRLCGHHQNGSVTPFLSAKTKLSEDAFNWFKHIQKEQGNFSYFEETVNKLFEIFPPIPDLGKPKLCSTCAVVGNSLNLKGSKYGPVIDSKDIIIRMNFAPINGYEEDVGTKTTHHVMYPESAVDLDNSTHLVLIPFKILDLEWLISAFTTGFHGKSYAPVKSRIQANKDLVIVINPAFMKDVHQIWLKKKGSYPSTGFITVVLALHICDEISLFGYGADRQGRWSHYFETLKNKNFKTGQHPGKQEYDILQKLNFEKVVKLYPGV